MELIKWKAYSRRYSFNIAKLIGIGWGQAEGVWGDWLYKSVYTSQTNGLALLLVHSPPDTTLLTMEYSGWHLHTHTHTLPSLPCQSTLVVFDGLVSSELQSATHTVNFKGMMWSNGVWPLLWLPGLQPSFNYNRLFVHSMCEGQQKCEAHTPT